MSLIQSISRGALNLRADFGEGTPGPADDFWYSSAGGRSVAGVRVTADSAKRLAAVMACVGVISRTFAMLPAKIFTDLANGGKKTVPWHPVYDLLASQPNARQTAFEFFEMMQGHLELRGNAFAEIVSGPRGPVDQLVPMHPDLVTVEQLANGRLRYKYNDPLLQGKTRVLVQDEVFHLRANSEDGITGQSTVAASADVYGVALAAQEYAARFFQNDGRPGSIIEGANFRNKVDGDNFLASWQRSQTGANRHKTAILPPGLTYKSIGVNPSDAQLLDSRKFSRIEICSLFGVPPHLIGETEKTATYASVEQFNIMFAVQCLLPRLVRWEQAIQRDLIQSPKYYAKFSMAALLRGDTTSRYGAYQVGIQNGWLNQNDVRGLEDLNPIEGGNTYWRPLAWAPLTQLTNPVVDDGTDTDEPQDATITEGGDPSDSDAGTDAAHQQNLKLLLQAETGKLAA